MSEGATGKEARQRVQVYLKKLFNEFKDLEEDVQLIHFEILEAKTVGADFAFLEEEKKTLELRLRKAMKKYEDHLAQANEAIRWPIKSGGRKDIAENSERVRAYSNWSYRTVSMFAVILFSIINLIIVEVHELWL